MPLFRKLIRCKCCFCMKLKTGCIVISFYTLFFGFINAGTIVDDVIYKRTGRTENAIKWFNVIHIGMMILGAVVLLIAVLSKFMKLAILWIIIFIIHIIGYYIVFHALPYGRNPLFSSALFISIYVLVMLITLGKPWTCIVSSLSAFIIMSRPIQMNSDQHVWTNKVLGKAKVCMPYTTCSSSEKAASVMITAWTVLIWQTQFSL